MEMLSFSWKMFFYSSGPSWERICFCFYWKHLAPSRCFVQVAQGSASPSKCIVGICPQAHVAFPSLSSHRGTSFGGQMKIAVAVPCEVSSASRNLSSAAWDCSVRAGSPRPCGQHYPSCAILLQSPALFFSTVLIDMQHTAYFPAECKFREDRDFPHFCFLLYLQHLNHSLSQHVLNQQLLKESRRRWFTEVMPSLGLS